MKTPPSKSLSPVKSDEASIWRHEDGHLTGIDWHIVKYGGL